MEKKIISTAAILGLVAISLGAFGAHALKKVLSLEQLNTFETGVKYQMYHALFLLFLGTTNMVSDRVRKRVFYLVISGVILFSGSIYLLATNSLTTIDFRIIGPLTPVGGFLLILAWLHIFISILNKKL